MPDNIPALNSRFTITFDTGQRALAVYVAPNADPLWVAQALGFLEPRPAIFMSGGAALMTPEDQRRTAQMLESVTDFAEERKAVVITGGTDSGIMQMLGDIRARKHYTFPLIGVAPLGKIDYPGYVNPAREAGLEDAHSHFVLAKGDEWGDETELLVRLTHAIAQGKMPTVGLLINGGKIARNEVYLATTRDVKLPMIVLEGSGRFADDLATAVRTGKTVQQILKAILEGGDITLVATTEGPEKMRQRLAERFDRVKP